MARPPHSEETRASRWGRNALYGCSWCCFEEVEDEEEEEEEEEEEGGSIHECLVASSTTRTPSTLHRISRNIATLHSFASRRLTTC